MPKIGVVAPGLRRYRQGMRRLLLAVGLAATGLVALPAAASAVIVNFGPSSTGPNVLNINDVAGTANNVRVSFTSNGQIQVSDTAGVTSTSIPPCTQTNPTTIRCPGDGTFVIKTQLGIGDDILVIDEFVLHGRIVSTEIFLGAGDDTAEGSEGDDDINGEDGDDEIDGDLGDDKASGGPGRDREEGGLGNDWLYGGANNDYLFGEQGKDWLFCGKGKKDKGNGGPGKDKQKSCEAGIRY
jgi:Ca2+-binding RTX toxin-like protein